MVSLVSFLISTTRFSTEISTTSTHHAKTTCTPDSTIAQVAAPVLYWKIENDNLFIAETQDFKTFESFSTPYINGNIVTIQRGIFRWGQFKLTP
jgi:hypothetical protein